MSASAQKSSSARAASTAARISGAETVAPTDAASVSTADRNSIRSASPIGAIARDQLQAGAPGLVRRRTGEQRAPARGGARSRPTARARAAAPGCSDMNSMM
jgi:hypothetical protein